MHELSLMESALEIAEDQARKQRAARIHALTLRIGWLAGVEPEALAFAWDAVTAGTPAEGAQLNVTMVPVVCFCTSCTEEFNPDGFIFACPRCGRSSSEVRQGTEMEVASLEVS